jgi:hypothetical protein
VATKKRKRVELDDEFTPNDVQKPKKPTKPNSGAYKHLDQHAKKIWEMDGNGVSPKDIATSICIDQQLPNGTITGHQVSLWMFYKKKSKQGKPRPVSIKNNNLEAEPSSDCVLFFS